MKTKQEIEKMMEDAGAWTSEGKTAVHGMSYEEGVDAALRWVLDDGNDCEPPIEEEP